MDKIFRRIIALFDNKMDKFLVSVIILCISFLDDFYLKWNT